MLAVWHSGLSVLFTAPTSRTSPSVTVRWEDIADCETPLERRSSVNLDGVRATVTLVSAGFTAILRKVSQRRTCSAEVAGVQCAS